MALVLQQPAGFDGPPEVVQKKKRRVAKLAKMIPRRKNDARPSYSAKEVSSRNIARRKNAPARSACAIRAANLLPGLVGGRGLLSRRLAAGGGTARGGWTILAVSCSGVTPWPVPV